MKKYWRDTKHHRDNGMDADIIRGISLGMDAILWPMGEKQRLLATLEGGNVMKKKVSFAALACALLMILLCSGAIGLTFPAEEPAASPIARVEKISFVIPAEEEYPSQVLIVEKMHYDGTNLLIGYRMEGEVNITEEPFEDTDAAARQKEGRLFGNEHVRTIWEEFPSVRKDRRKMESRVLNRYEWVVDNRLAEGCEESFVVDGDDGLTYLCFENLGEALQDQDAIHIQLPLLKAHSRAVWYSYDENHYYGVTGSSGDTQAIALSVPRSMKETIFPSDGTVRESAVDMVMEDGTHYLIRAQNGFPEYHITVEESVMQYSQMQITLLEEGETRFTHEMPDGVIPDWNYAGTLKEVQNAPETYLQYYPEFRPYLYTLKEGDTLTGYDLYASAELVDDLGQYLLRHGELYWQSYNQTDSRKTNVFMPNGFTDELPFWYGQNQFTVHMPIRYIYSMLHVDRNGKVYTSMQDVPGTPVLPVTVTVWERNGKIWGAPIYSAYGDAEETENGVFLLGGDVRLEIKEAAYDGENIVIGYKLQPNDRFRVSQELETVHWELTGPWTDLKVSYEYDVTYHRYQIRDTMDADDEKTSRTAKELIWKNRDQIAVSLVIGELENGTLSTQGTPRIRILLQNSDK